MRNGGRWTDARFRSFIVGALRSASNRWGPKFSTKKQARVERGIYNCAGYKRKGHKVPASILGSGRGKKRVNNVYVDHIIPVIGPEGFQSWDQFIERLFCEEDNLQVLCKECHDRKTQDEKEERKKKKV